ncbi:DUF365 domain-containing protein, partial [bacterium]|nr:DUF365 domain-containing protein [bacterium]
FSSRWKGHKISLYSTAPVQSFVGEATIENIEVGEPNSIWERYNRDICCTKEEYDSYVKSTKEIYAIILNDVQAFNIEIPRSQISHLLSKDIRPPQSYYNLKNNKEWSEAVSIASLLQKNFKNTAAINI